MPAAETKGIRLRSHAMTLHEFTLQWLPRSWRFARLFEWPPDVFAWTSCVLQRTGAYRLAVSPPQAWPRTADWQERVQTVSASWLAAIERSDRRLPSRIRSVKARLEELMDDVSIEDLARQGSEPPLALTAAQRKRQRLAATRAWEATQAILELHAYADRCCIGFGSPALQSRFNHPRTQYLSDLLLARYGSVSRLPREVGSVLPKMRTPQSGVTLRALSLYASYHESELEIAWRSLPWTNIDENTINLLVVPWPFEVRATDFKPRAIVGEQIRSGRARYFAFEPIDRPFDPQDVLRLIEDSQAHAKRIHMIVLPELALTEDELEALQNALVEHQKSRTHVPIIIAGLRGARPGATSEAAIRGESNRLVFSLFFAERWYNLEQEKHHRWKLDPSQIEQYRLGGTLTGTSPWWEGCEIRQRRLTFVAPNDWLVLCPLICEDLAQLDPVSQVIRGVGPTLVWALLLDGPQLPQRWPSRYAGVLSSDPGSSVLTVTAAGMVKRSRRKHDQGESDGKREDSATVALWNDARRGAREVPAPAAGGVVMTLCVEWSREHTLDSRHDDETAAQFVLNGVHFLPLASRNSASQPERTPEDTEELHSFAKGRTRRVTDIKELTVFAIFLDAAIDSSPADRARYATWVLQSRSRLARPSRGLSPAHQDLVSLIGAHSDEHEDREFELAVRVCLRILDEVDPGSVRSARVRWSRLVARAAKSLASLSDGRVAANDDAREDRHVRRAFAVRAHVAVWNTILWAIHTRLTEERRHGTLNRTGAGLLGSIESLLDRRYDRVLARLSAEDAEAARPSV